jgi:hypothetical protein
MFSGSEAFCCSETDNLMRAENSLMLHPKNVAAKYYYMVTRFSVSENIVSSAQHIVSCCISKMLPQNITTRLPSILFVRI